MDDRIERTSDAAVARSILGRREMLQRTGFVVGVGALWATPLVQTIGMRPAAATEVILDACPDTGGGAGQPSDLTWKVDPARGGSQSNTSTTLGDDQDNPAVIDGTLKCLENTEWTVEVEVFSSKTITGTTTPVKVSWDDPFFTVPGKPGAWTSFRITVLIPDPAECGPQTIEGIHTSCSQPLEVDFWWGAIELISVGEAGSKGW